MKYSPEFIEAWYPSQDRIVPLSAAMMNSNTVCYVISVPLSRNLSKPELHLSRVSVGKHKNSLGMVT